MHRFPCPGILPDGADHIEEAWQTKAVVTMQMCDEYPLDVPWINVRFDELCLCALSTIYQVCCMVEATCDAGYIPGCCGGPR